jgi:hypothetical protein
MFWSWYKYFFADNPNIMWEIWKRIPIYRAKDSSSEFELGIRARILVRLSWLRKILRIFCLALVYEEQYGESSKLLTIA